MADKDETAPAKPPKATTGASTEVNTALVPNTDPVEEAVKRGVEAFVANHLRNSDFSRDTPAWNHFQAGLPALIESIVKEVKG